MGEVTFLTANKKHKIQEQIPARIEQNLQQETTNISWETVKHFIEIDHGHLMGRWNTVKMDIFPINLKEEYKCSHDPSGYGHICHLTESF